MKISENFEIRNVGGINIVVPLGGNMSLSGVITLNESALFVWNTLKDDITEEELINKICAEYDAPREIIEKDVEELLAQFKENGLINE